MVQQTVAIGAHCREWFDSHAEGETLSPVSRLRARWPPGVINGARGPRLGSLIHTDVPSARSEGPGGQAEKSTSNKPHAAANTTVPPRTLTAHICMAPGIAR
ncbi:hypothetical protein AAFF_G00236430 [Aldrovandia affinis]|uniref:Uncharacterized protein n=1 Tax=Aldrovandia affinis TaxID=143900 RepID=A0AAD7W440_9TELE|nr:hypothetical protein AAFF_G00236430 [Aldrovandia affinis]